MVGPAFGLENFWVSEGHSFGVTAAGGAGWQLAEWVVNGEPSVDMLGVDPRRFGVVAKNFAKIKNEEAYAHVFVNHFPMEERAEARPAKTIPVYDRLDNAGAVWGARFGWERPNWFAPQNVERRDNYSFRRSNWFEHVGNKLIDIFSSRPSLYFKFRKRGQFYQTNVFTSGANFITNMFKPV